MASAGRRTFSVILAIIIIAVLGLGGYLAYKYISDFLIQKEASDIVDEFENSIIVVAVEDEQTNQETVVENTVGTPTSSGTTTKKSSGVRYQGYNVIGTIQIPKTGVKYPIVDDTTPAAMDRAIVFLYGPGLNKVGNNVIVGHNYRSGGLFGSNRRLVNGDKIYITDSSGTKVEYSVYRKYETSDADFSYATRNTNGKREISLSTCTSNASTRLIIWAREQ